VGSLRRRLLASPWTARAARCWRWTRRTGTCGRPSCGWTCAPPIRRGGCRRRETPRSSTTATAPSPPSGCPPRPSGSKRTNRRLYNNARRICECQDWVTHKLTGKWTASINNTSIRWYYDRNTGGWPESLYRDVGLDDVLEKFPENVLDMGTVVGGLRKEAAEELGAPGRHARGRRGDRRVRGGAGARSG
jgi:hypothetical protein